MADEKKIVTIKRSKETGWWRWSVDCYDGNGQFLGSESGAANSKRAAKNQAGGVACGVNIVIMPPKINATIINGRMAYFEMINPWTEQFHTLIASEVSENELFWIAGIGCYDDSLSSSLKRVVAMLKVWDVYLGGDSEKGVQELHDLSDEEFDIISEKTWTSVEIIKTIDDYGEIHLGWNIVDEC